MTILVSYSLYLQVILSELNNQVFEDSSTYRGTLKTLARTIVATKYDLENAEFDEDRFSNQQGWWDYLESGARELIEKCTFLHQGEDNNVRSQCCFIAGADGRLFRVYQITLTTPHLRSFACCSTILVLMQLAIYSLTS